MTESTIRVKVRDWVGERGALEPSAATRLAQHVVEKRSVVGRLVLDFAGVGTISSGFANELFLTLAQVRPLDEWRQFLEFTGLASSQAQVITKSLHAARRLAQKSP